MFAEIKNKKIVGLYGISQKEGRGDDYKEIEVEDSDPRVIAFNNAAARVGTVMQAKARIRECNLYLVDDTLAGDDVKALRSCRDECKKVISGDRDDLPAFPELSL